MVLNPAYGLLCAGFLLSALKRFESAAAFNPPEDVAPPAPRETTTAAAFPRPIT
jgi:hypothetical protein